MFSLMTASRRCQGLCGFITVHATANSSCTNNLCKEPLCSPFVAGTTINRKSIPWMPPNLTRTQASHNKLHHMYHQLLLFPHLQGSKRNGGTEIVFFDLETTYPKRAGEKPILLEFGAVVLSAHNLEEIDEFTDLIRPPLPSTDIPNKMRDENFSKAPLFVDIAPKIFELLNGRIWAGHNIEAFDARLIREAFHSIGQIPPVQSGMIDTFKILKNQFETTQMQGHKLSNFAEYFGLGQQQHSRSLPDVRLNIDVLKRCATLLFLKPNITPSTPSQGASTGVSRQEAIRCSIYKNKGNPSEAGFKKKDT